MLNIELNSVFLMRCSVSYKSKVAMVLGCIGLVSCSAIPDVTHQGQPTGTTAQSRHSGATPSLVCVVQPGDPSNGQEKAAGSGAEIGRRILQSVQQAGSKTLMIQGDTGQPSAECLRRGSWPASARQAPAPAGSAPARPDRTGRCAGSRRAAPAGRSIG
mgnify:CR=1 FL=1